MTTARKSVKKVKRSLTFQYFTGATLISLMIGVAISLTGQSGFEHFWLFVGVFFMSMFFSAKVYLTGWVAYKIIFFIAITLPNILDNMTGNYPGRPKK
jgi:hypothetical protein